MVATNNETHGGPNAEESRRGNPDSAGTANDVSWNLLLSATSAPKTKTMTVVEVGLIYQLPSSAQLLLSSLFRLGDVLEGRQKIVRYIDPAPHKEGDHA